MSFRRHLLSAFGLRVRLFLAPLRPLAMITGIALGLPFATSGAIAAPPTAPSSLAGEGVVVSNVARSEYTRARLLIADRRVAPGESVYVGLELDMDPLWHTYWKNPGDSGLATSIRWTLPSGISAGEIIWPTPRRIFVEPLMSYGYGSDDPRQPGRAVLFTRIDVAEDAPPGPATIAGAVEWLECKEICLPGEGRLKLGLVVARSDEVDAANTATNVRKASPTPDPAAFARLPRGAIDSQALPANLRSRAAIAADHVRIEIDGLPPEFAYGAADDAEAAAASGPYFFVESEGLVAHAAPQAVQVFADGRIVFRIPRDLAANQLPAKEVRGVLKFAPDALSVVNEAWQIRAPLVSGMGGWLERIGVLAGMFAFALLGGALLNLMPCVLPVLSLKVLALVQGIADDSRRERLLAGSAFTAGVVATFLLLAGVLLALQAAGAAVGWGYQLQSPAFVLVLSGVVGVFALNLLGVYEFRVAVPRWLSAQTSPSPSHSQSQSQSGASHFAAGVLATVLATPCTAPFMGTAMGFAFTQGAATTLLIFMGLGLGMALPYLIFAVFPGALGWLPKPGRWMESFKQFSGFLLLATALWLLWIFGRLAGADAQSLALGTLLALGLAAWIYGRWFSGLASSGGDVTGGDAEPAGTNIRRVYISAIVAFWGVVGLAGALGWFALQAAASNSGTAGGNSGQAGGAGAAKQRDAQSVADWRVYSPERVAALRAEGRPVFIDFTADWCLSCKVNEALTFRSERVWRRMRELDVTAFQADWTRQDPVITAALRSYGRSGVPLYVLYGPQSDASPRILPEVLSEGLFLAELEKLGSPPAKR